MKLWRMVLVVLAAFSLASCSSEPEYADPEASLQHVLSSAVLAPFPEIVVPCHT